MNNQGLKIYKVRKEARAEAEKMREQGINATVFETRIETKARRKVAYYISECEKQN